MMRSLAIVSAALTSTALAGPLDPPAGPVSPTAKTLQVVEPRIPIGPDTTPGDDDSLFRITEGGSYYLTENVIGEADKAGIEVAANNITIDLNGFALIGIFGTLDGIGTDPDEAISYFSITIRNGTVRNWRGHGIGGSRLSGTLVADIHAQDNSDNGIEVNPRSIIDRCIVEGNNANGIKVPSMCIVQNCTSTSNLGAGIEAGSDNQIRACIASFNDGNGVEGGSRNLIKGNLATGNDLHGISVGAECVVWDNYAHGNGATIDTTGYGFLTKEDASVFERNIARSNNNGGFVITGSDNLLIHNKASSNFGVGNFDIDPGNAAGPVLAPVDLATSSNPHANYSY